MGKLTCVFCSAVIKDFGHNPDCPDRKAAEGERCCGDCNLELVVPSRLMNAAEGYGEAAVDPVEILRKFSTWNVLYHTPTQTQYAMRQLILALVETTKDQCPELAKAVIYQMPYGEADE